MAQNKLNPDKFDVEIYKDAAREYRWHLVHANGRFLADSGEGYKRKAHAVAMILKLFNPKHARNLIDSTVKGNTTKSQPFKAWAKANRDA